MTTQQEFEKRAAEVEERPAVVPVDCPCCGSDHNQIIPGCTLGRDTYCRACLSCGLNAPQENYVGAANVTWNNVARLLVLGARVRQMGYYLDGDALCTPTEEGHE